MYPGMYFQSLAKLCSALRRQTVHNCLKILKIFLIYLSLNEFNLSNLFYQEIHLFYLLWVLLLSLISDLCCPHPLSQGREKEQWSLKYFHCCWLLKTWWSDNSVQPVNIRGFHCTAEICLKELVPIWTLWKSLIWTDCHLSLFLCLLIAQLQGSVFQLFLWCAFCCFSHGKEIIPTSTWKNHCESWSSLPTLLTHVLLLLPGQSFYGSHPFQKQCPLKTPSPPVSEREFL